MTPLASRMQSRLWIPALLASLIGLAGSAELHTAQPSAAPHVTPHPDLRGTWLGLARAGIPKWANTPYTPTPEFTQFGKQESERLQVDNVGVCDLSNPVFFMVDLGMLPLQILDGGNQIDIQNEFIMQPRRIYTDGRPHPADPDPTWLGHSIGHWEKDVLVVDTIGTNGRGRALNGLTSNGPGAPVSREPRLPSSESLHVIERLRLLEKGTILEDEFMIEDPKIYTRPFSFKKYFQRRQDVDLVEMQCI